MKRDSFIFYASFYNAIKEIPNENQLKVYQAITNFALTGQEPTDLNGIEKAVFILVKPQIIANNQRYINGCGGGRPKKEEKTKKKDSKKTNGFENQKPKQNQTETKVKPNENENVNENVNDNENDKQIEQPKQPVAVVPKKVPQQRVFDYFADKYKALTGFKYKSKSSDFVNLAKLIKDYGEDKVNQKIDWLEVGCVNRVFWFAKESGVNSFTIGNLVRNWNEILPQYTKEQMQERERKRKEEETMRRVLENVKKRREEEQKWNTQ